MNLKGHLRQVLAENLFESWEGKTFHDVFFPDMKKLNTIPTDVRQVIVDKMTMVYCSVDALYMKFASSYSEFQVSSYNQKHYYLTVKLITAGYKNEIISDMNITDMILRQGDLI